MQNKQTDLMKNGTYDLVRGDEKKMPIRIKRCL